MQQLTDQQKKAFDQSVPSIGTSGRAAGDIINSLFQLGGTTVSYTTNATANTEDTVKHNLGYKPNGFIVIQNGDGGVVYNGATAWDETNISLECTTASNAVTILVF